MSFKHWIAHPSSEVDLAEENLLRAQDLKLYKLYKMSLRTQLEQGWKSGHFLILTSMRRMKLSSNRSERGMEGMVRTGAHVWKLESQTFDLKGIVS
jgi:hypothetical protein